MTTKDLATQLLESQAREAVWKEATYLFIEAFDEANLNLDEAALFDKAFEHFANLCHQTIPDGFAQRVAAVGRVGLNWIGDSENSLSSSFVLALLAGHLKALTPEDVALLEAMKGGGS